MDITTMNEIDRQCDAYVEKLLGLETTGHDVQHARRVKLTALYIGSLEGGDPFRISLTALLHDVDDPKVFPEQAGKLVHAAEFLGRYVDAELSREILSDISAISFKGTGKTVPASLEGKIVQDADRLDALGWIGIGRAFAFGGSRHRLLWDGSLPRQQMTEQEYRSAGTTVNHFYEKLFRLKDLMNTKTGRRLSFERDSEMRDFLQGFIAQWRMRPDVGSLPHNPDEIVITQDDGKKDLVFPSDCTLVFLDGQSFLIECEGGSVLLGKEAGTQRYLSFVAGQRATVSCPLDYSKILVLDTGL